MQQKIEIIKNTLVSTAEQTRTIYFYLPVVRRRVSQKVRIRESQRLHKVQVYTWLNLEKLRLCSKTVLPTKQFLKQLMGWSKNLGEFCLLHLAFRTKISHSAWFVWNLQKEWLCTTIHRRGEKDYVVHASNPRSFESNAAFTGHERFIQFHSCRKHQNRSWETCTRTWWWFSTRGRRRRWKRAHGVGQNNSAEWKHNRFILFVKYEINLVLYKLQNLLFCSLFFFQMIASANTFANNTPEMLTEVFEEKKICIIFKFNISQKKTSLIRKLSTDFSLFLQKKSSFRFFLRVESLIIAEGQLNFKKLRNAWSEKEGDPLQFLVYTTIDFDHRSAPAIVLLVLSRMADDNLDLNLAAAILHEKCTLMMLLSMTWTTVTMAAISFSGQVKVH